MSTHQTQFPAGRLLSVDAYRGFVMLLMMGEVLRFGQLHEALPANPVWALLAYHQDHVAWAGCSLHDLIQPSFSFLVGVALPYSIASQDLHGVRFSTQFIRALRRSLILILLGIFLRSTHAQQTYFTFEDTLTQIGLGYPFLFLLGRLWSDNTTAGRKGWVTWVTLTAILVGYWALFVSYPLPGPAFDYPAVGVPANWPYHAEGLMAHFNKNSNVAWAFDTWFLNLFPRENPFRYNGGGYATLSFIPTLGTMLLGLAAGQWLRLNLPANELLRRFILTGCAGLAAGLLLQGLGICPVVKRIWTPAWVLFSGGWCFLLLALFYGVIDVWKKQRWAFPLVVIGMNSIAIYCLVHLIEGFVISAFYIHLGHRPFQLLGTVYEPLLVSLATLLVYWLVLHWMYRRKLFIRI